MKKYSLWSEYLLYAVSRKGQGLTEYALIIGLIGIAVVTTLSITGSSFANFMEFLRNAIGNVMSSVQR